MISACASTPTRVRSIGLSFQIFSGRFETVPRGDRLPDGYNLGPSYVRFGESLRPCWFLSAPPTLTLAGAFLPVDFQYVPTRWRALRTTPFRAYEPSPSRITRQPLHFHGSPMLRSAGPSPGASFLLAITAGDIRRSMGAHRLCRSKGPHLPMPAEAYSRLT